MCHARDWCTHQVGTWWRQLVIGLRVDFHRPVSQENTLGIKLSLGQATQFLFPNGKNKSRDPLEGEYCCFLRLPSLAALQSWSLCRPACEISSPSDWARCKCHFLPLSSMMLDMRPGAVSMQIHIVALSIGTLPGINARWFWQCSLVQSSRISILHQTLLSGPAQEKKVDSFVSHESVLLSCAS